MHRGMHMCEHMSLHVNVWGGRDGEKPLRGPRGLCALGTSQDLELWCSLASAYFGPWQVGLTQGLRPGGRRPSHIQKPAGDAGLACLLGRWPAAQPVRSCRAFCPLPPHLIPASPLLASAFLHLWQKNNLPRTFLRRDLGQIIQECGWHISPCAEVCFLCNGA